MPLQHSDNAIANIGHYTAWGGGGIAVLGGLTANEFAAFCGGAAAICGVLVQVYFKLRHDRRLKALIALKQERERLEIQRLNQTVGQEQA